MQKGFTIIELLAVIAIISALATIVLTNMVNYSIKSKDSAIKEDMHQILLNGAVYFDNNGSYGAFCNNATTQLIYNAIVSTKKNCNHSAPSWAVCARLNIPQNGSIAWCVDSTGTKKEISDTQCTNGIHACP